MMSVKAYLEVTMKIPATNRKVAAKVYTDYRQPFLDTTAGAQTKQLLVRDEDVQVLRGFDFVEHSQCILEQRYVYQACFSWSSANLGRQA